MRLQWFLRCRHLTLEMFTGTIVLLKPMCIGVFMDYLIGQLTPPSFPLHFLYFVLFSFVLWFWGSCTGIIVDLLLRFQTTQSTFSSRGQAMAFPRWFEKLCTSQLPGDIICLPQMSFLPLSNLCPLSLVCYGSNCIFLKVFFFFFSLNKILSNLPGIVFCVQWWLTKNIIPPGVKPVVVILLQMYFLS